ncbi:MAG: 2TM domain-containing protein [Rhodoferax sp.]|uniref:2TM domain-containing protein n=1 Tax=Rhodoferax sp. TaxID=50421 RepID=UPI002ACE64E6|nr:2TM domain-containing protein [Rhodoferax sp.]MDZ7892943.1 2TM domain-containing protein [Rhodoferax sp.]
MNALTALSPADLERLARKRAGAKMGWYIHATVFILVNAGLTLLAALQGLHWAVFPAAGWALSLAIHGAVVFARPQGASLFQKLLVRERQALQAQRDPW